MPKETVLNILNNKFLPIWFVLSFKKEKSMMD